MEERTIDDELRFYAALTDGDLLTAMPTLVARERDITASVVAALAELDARKLHRREGFSSLYVYCTQRLHLSEHAAYKRIAAAKAVRRFPVVLDRLRSGSVTLSSLDVLAPHLTSENHVALLDAADHKSRRAVERHIAALYPIPDPPTIVTPISADRYRLQVTLSGETYRTLRRLQDLMRHAIPSGDPAVIVTRALALLKERVKYARLGTAKRPRSHGLSVSPGRYVPAAVKREVWKRDGARCAFVGTVGRCTERAFLELHHVIPYADGGLTTVENLQLRCRAHNAHEAEEHDKGVAG